MKNLSTVCFTDRFKPSEKFLTRRTGCINIDIFDRDFHWHAARTQNRPLLSYLFTPLLGGGTNAQAEVSNISTEGDTSDEFTGWWNTCLSTMCTWILSWERKVCRLKVQTHESTSEKYRARMPGLELWHFIMYPSVPGFFFRKSVASTSLKGFWSNLRKQTLCISFVAALIMRRPYLHSPNLDI